MNGPSPAPVGARCCGAFAGARGPDRALVLICAAVNALVLLNAVVHDPAVGYDAFHHLRQLETLAAGRLPSMSDSQAFFSPPLPAG